MGATPNLKVALASNDYGNGNEGGDTGVDARRERLLDDDALDAVVVVVVAQAFCVCWTCMYSVGRFLRGRYRSGKMMLSGGTRGGMHNKCSTAAARQAIQARRQARKQARKQAREQEREQVRKKARKQARRQAR